jgi:hypothetical protein
MTGVTPGSVTMTAAPPAGTNAIRFRDQTDAAVSKQGKFLHVEVAPAK